ncbi:MAG: hypothetical protein JSW40_08420 [Candidatus Omnitrophota bacterium]|nr:MAG: hypothetical protein JSW40_08420 [Candidatus Omnitrophota bacterium]
MLVLYRESPDRDVVGIEQHNRNVFKRLWNKVYNRIISSELNAYENTRAKDFGPFSDDRSVYAISKHPLVKEADIIHLHWIAKMVNHTEFFSNI